MKSSKNKVLVTGGLGYVGSLLVAKLARQGYQVSVLDTGWFGNWLDSSLEITYIQGNILEIESLKLPKVDFVIHLANIANDPSVELNENFSWEVNTLGTQLLLNWCKTTKIERFIYASSGSVYGISSDEDVNENSNLNPISVYNKTKMVAEKVVKSFSDDFQICIVRPGTVCGYSPRMRLDLTINAMTFSGLNQKVIKVDGGNQVRPHVHIDDLVEAYIFLLEGPAEFTIVNIGFENLTVLEAAMKIREITKADIQLVNSIDPRSYFLNSSKLISLGFKPKFSVNHAIMDLVDKYNTGLLIEREQWYTVPTLKKILAK